MDDLQKVLADLVQQMGEAAIKYGPGAVDAAGHYLQLKAIIDLVTSGVALVFVYLGFRLAHWLGTVAFKESKKLDENEGVVFGAGIGAFFISVVLLFVSLGAVIDLMSTKTWIAAISPRLALVQLAVDKVEK